MKVHLPIDDSIAEIRSALENHPNLIVVAAPGAGKTTRVPPNLLSQTSKKILMLQPRRIAARASAERISEENAWTLGQEVGYRVRFEDCTSAKTRIIVVTEALLMRELLRDPELSDYGIIILDEFHERNLYSDAGLAAVRELQQLSRPDLKIVIMSATIDAAPLQRYLAPATTVDVPGRTFPVEVIYDQQSQLLNTDRTFIERTTNKVLEALFHTEANKHILVFLPGLSEIQRIEEALTKSSRLPQQRKVFKLHGSLSLDEQHEVLHSQAPKIILATNVAETSLTIDGVNTVVDSGLARELQNDQRRLFPWLKTTRISRASAEQRKGRAGRQYPGRCFRLWTKLDEQSMPPFAAPDIMTQDLTELLLTLCQLGVSDPKNFSWFEVPPITALDRAKQFLLTLELITSNEEILRLTDLGQWIQRLPLPPRLGVLLHRGLQEKNLSLAAQIAALLNERDPWARENLDSWQSSSQDSDLVPRLKTLNQEPLAREFQTIDKLAKQLCRQLSQPYERSTVLSAATMTKLLLAGFSDRVTRRRRPQDKAGLVVGQKGIELKPQSLVRNSEFFLSLTGHANESNGNAIVDLAHPITKAQLFDTFNEHIEVRKKAEYSQEKDAWISIEQKFFRDLPIEEPNIKPLVLDSESLLPVVKEAFQMWKTNDPALQQFYRRLDLAKELWPTAPWPELSLWENETIEMACLGETSLQTIREKNWSELFALALSTQESKRLLKDLPATMTTPRGRTFSLDYEPGGLVNLEIKIQEAYGWQDTPRIAEGRIKIRLILLGPHMRPLQTTDDLRSFWEGTYRELRPSLKARYPKHLWPEMPWVLPADSPNRK